VIADALARAGVGRLTIIDRDVVEATNLQRQVLFVEDDAAAGRPKAEAAAARLASVNSGIRIEPVVADLNPRNVERLIDGAAVVIDGTDNFQTRYLLNDACVKHRTPLVYGGVVGTAGMNMTILPGVTPCLRCIFPEPPPPGSAPTCDTAGVLGPMAGIIAGTQAAEALKVLLGRLDLVRAALVEQDVWHNRHRVIDLSRTDRAACPCCGEGRFEFLDAPAAGTTSLCGTDSVQVLPMGGAAEVGFDLAGFVERMRRAGQGEFTAGRFMARGRVDGLGLTVFADGRAIVSGTTDAGRARSVCARWIGG
jgi:adenylyltransferase/sulfurtransferase